jgi:signal transduction histidine kinase
MSKPSAGTRHTLDQTDAATVGSARAGAEPEQALQEKQREREESEAVTRAKDRFLAMLSHELRTPLTPVVMALHTLLRRNDLPESAREALEMVQRNVKIESNLIDDLLDLTRITYGRFDIDSAPVDLHAAMNSAVDMCESDLRGKKQTLIVTLQASSHRTQGDFDRLRQVVFNLVQNASKFTREGGEIQVASRNNDGRFLFAVSDNGTGIARDALPAIFDAFRRGGRSAMSEFGGLGLGLAIAKASVEAHGGTIRAESAGPGCGATFTVQLPLT